MLRTYVQRSGAVAAVRWLPASTNLDELIDLLGELEYELSFGQASRRGVLQRTGTLTLWPGSKNSLKIGLDQPVWITRQGRVVGTYTDEQFARTFRAPREGDDLSAAAPAEPAAEDPHDDVPAPAPRTVTFAVGTFVDLADAPGSPCPTNKEIRRTHTADFLAHCRRLMQCSRPQCGNASVYVYRIGTQVSAACSLHVEESQDALRA